MTMASLSRSPWTELSDQQLLLQCAVDTYRASGPGGQKRNKTSSAVRLRHLPTGLIVIAEESRSQYQNRARALRRLREALYLKLRNQGPLGMLAKQSGLHETIEGEGRLHLGRKDVRFWPAVGAVLDVLESTESRVSEAAEILGISTGNLIDFLSVEPKVWEQANHLRRRYGAKPLRG
jgi:hypothetical protein